MHGKETELDIYKIMQSAQSPEAINILLLKTLFA